ncbi:hypothetical protein [Halobacillus andaensis]|uniref:hypothetical protein n=1 Tax=Halobacillus andaensis TaxID=1176239 RepID=UPI003D7323EB
MPDQKEEKKPSKWKTVNPWLKWTALTIALALSWGVFWGIGLASATSEVDGEKLAYEELVNKSAEQSTELKEIEGNLKHSQEEYKEVLTLIDDKNALEEQMKTLTDDIETKEEENKKLIEELQQQIKDKEKETGQEIDKFDSQLKEKNGELKQLEEDIQAKKDELKAVTGNVEEAKGEPVTLSAGFFDVGKDLPAGRYKVTPASGNGNFFVNDGMKVNILLGHDELFEEEYVFTADDGDVIELTLSATFTPIE